MKKLFLLLAAAAGLSAQTCSVTNPNASTVVLYAQNLQLTLSCTSVPSAYKAIWYYDYQRIGTGLVQDQRLSMIDSLEAWNGTPFSMNWQPGLNGDGQHTVYAVVTDIFDNVLATTPTVTFAVDIQGLANHFCIVTAPPSTSDNNLPCPTTPINSMSGQGWLQIAAGDPNVWLNRYNLLIDGEPVSDSYYGHYNPCGMPGTNSSRPYYSIGGFFGAPYPGLATFCWPNGPNLFQYGFQGGNPAGTAMDPFIASVALPTSGSPSGNRLYFNPGNYPAGHWFYNGEPIVFSGAPPAPLQIGGFWCGPGSPNYWSCSSNEITAISFSGQTATLTLNTNPISSGAAVGGNIFVRNIPYTDQTSGQQPCDGQFTITAVTSSTIQFAEPSGCNTTIAATNLSKIYANVELYVNPYCAIYVDKNDVQLSSTFLPIQPPNGPPGSFQCGSALPLTGSYSSTATVAKGRMRSPYWSSSSPDGSNNGSTYGNDFLNGGSPPAFNTQLVTFNNGSAGMEIQPAYGEFHGYAGKSGDTLCPGGNLAILNTDYSNTNESCSAYTFTFTQDGGVTGAISFNSSTGAITYNPASSWSDPNHQSAWAHVAIAGNFCGPSHNATCPGETVNIENHGAAITFPHWSTCGVIAQAFNSGLPPNCYSFFPRSEWIGTATPFNVTWPWKLYQDSNVNSTALYSFNQGNANGLTNYSSTGCPSWPDSYFSSLVSFAQQYGLYIEGDIYYGLVSPQGVNFGQGASLILNNVGFNRQSCLQSLVQWMTTAPNNRFWDLLADDEVPNDIGANVLPNPSPSIANASSPMAAYLPSITSLGVSGGVMTATVTNIGNLAGAWSQSAGTGNAFQLTGLTTNSACNGWYLISGISGSGPYTITAPVPSYLSGCTASSITDSGGVMNLPSYTTSVPANASIVPANPGQGCPFVPSIDCQALSSSVYITVSGSTAMVTWPNHKLSTGQAIRIWGGSTANLNIIAPITVTGPNTFTYVYPGGAGGSSPTCSGAGGQCNNVTDARAYITVDPGYGSSMLNSMWSVIDSVSNAPAHCYSLFGLSYGAGAWVVYNWMTNPANVSCGGLLYIPGLPTNYTQPDITNVQMAGYSYSPAVTWRPFLRYPRSILYSDNYIGGTVGYCRSFGFNPSCDKPTSGADDLNWSPEIAVTQFMSAKATGVAGFRHYKGYPGGQANAYNWLCCGWSTLGSPGYGPYADPNTAARSWNGLAHTYALLHAREDTALQPETNKAFLNYYTLIDAHTSATYGNETDLTCVSSYHCGGQALPLNPISGGSLILYLDDGYTTRVYTSATMSTLAGNPSSIVPPSGDWGVSPMTGQQSPGLTWTFVSLPANYTPLDSLTFTPPATLPSGASKFLIQVGYYPEDMRADPVTDCTAGCTIPIDHHDLNAWYRTIYTDGNGIPKRMGQPVELTSQGLY